MEGREALVRSIERLFRDALAVEPPPPDVDLMDAGLLDSLALVELLFALERELGVTIPLEDLDVDRFRTIDGIAALVAEAGATPESDAA